jgi:hypothetical protein
MDTLLAIVVFALSLFGIDIGSHTRIDRIRSNGMDVLYSKVIEQPTITRFECVRSASGQCHYTVYAPDCAATGQPANARMAGCASIHRFTLARGDARQMTARRGLRVCVSAEAIGAAPDCDAPEVVALQ